MKMILTLYEVYINAQYVESAYVSLHESAKGNTWNVIVITHSGLKTAATYSSRIGAYAALNELVHFLTREDGPKTFIFPDKDLIEISTEL